MFQIAVSVKTPLNPFEVMYGGIDHRPRVSRERLRGFVILTDPHKQWRTGMNENMVKAVLWKADDLNKSQKKHYDSVEKTIDQIELYLNGKIKLSEEQIAYHVNQLTLFTIGIPVSIPLTSNTLFSRARKCKIEERNKFYTEVSKLSYKTGVSINQGRLNPAGKALFYACYGTYNETRNAVLSEVIAKQGEVVNILVSGTKPADSENRLDHFLHIVPIGILDYFRKGVPTPYKLHDSYREIYNLLSDNTIPEAMRSVHLCDEFLTDILKRPETEKLYDVTSAIGTDFLKNDEVDGILYPSTRYKEFPNVAIKPTSVKTKLQYHATKAVEVALINEHGIYSIKPLGNGLVDGNQVRWFKDQILS